MDRIQREWFARPEAQDQESQAGRAFTILFQFTQAFTKCFGSYSRKGQEVWNTRSTDLHSSNQQREARLQLLDSCHGGALGPLIQEANLVKDDGTTTTMFLANLLVYMMAIYHQDGSWTKLVQQHHAECPGTISDPWG